MKIFDKICRFIKSNINWLLNIEEPVERRFEERIKELEDILLKEREDAASYGANFRRLENEMSRLQKQEAQCIEKAGAALKNGDEAAARAALQEKIDYSEQIYHAAADIEKGREVHKNLQDNVTMIAQQIKEAKHQLQELIRRQYMVNARKSFDQRLHLAAESNKKIEVDCAEAFRAASEVEGNNCGWLQVMTLDEYELTRNSRELQVEAQLQALKKQMDIE